MPKSRKQRTGIKKKQKPSPRKRRSNESLSESATKKKTPKAAAVKNTVGRPKSAHKFEMQQVHSVTKKIENFENVSVERSSIISIVKDLEEQVETAFNLKEALEAELDATQKKLSKELAARARLEARVISLEAQVALEDQSHKHTSFAEEERDKFTNLPAEIQPSNSTGEALSTREAIRSIVIEELARLQNAEGKVTLLGLEKRVQLMAEAIEALQNKIAEMSIRGPVSETDMWEAMGSLEAAELLTNDERAMLVNVFRQNIALQKPELVGVAVN